jgi:tetratricopeptide (TPR) repeat protein
VTRLRSILVLLLLLIGAFSLSTAMSPFFFRASNDSQTDVLEVLLGDSRRLLANQFFAKADAYFHAGYYPGIFDNPLAENGKELIEHSGKKSGPGEHGREVEKDEDDYLGPPKDWIDGFGRHFFPSQHVHLNAATEIQEILPWLKLSAEMNPHLTATYTVSAFWLRTELGRVAEAEEFLREGLRANPGDPEILLELGRVKAESRKDDAVAENLWEVALHNVEISTNGFATNTLLHAELVGQLERLEERHYRWKAATRYLAKLREISPFKSAIDEQIKELDSFAEGQPPRTPSKRGVKNVAKPPEKPPEKPR